MPVHFEDISHSPNCIYEQKTEDENNHQMANALNNKINRTDALRLTDVWSSCVAERSTNHSVFLLIVEYRAILQTFNDRIGHRVIGVVQMIPVNLYVLHSRTTSSSAN